MYVSRLLPGRGGRPGAMSTSALVPFRKVGLADRDLLSFSTLQYEWTQQVDLCPSKGCQQFLQYIAQPVFRT